MEIVIWCPIHQLIDELSNYKQVVLETFPNFDWWAHGTRRTQLRVCTQLPSSWINTYYSQERLYRTSVSSFHSVQNNVGDSAILVCHISLLWCYLEIPVSLTKFIPRKLCYILVTTFLCIVLLNNGSPDMNSGINMSISKILNYHSTINKVLRPALYFWMNKFLILHSLIDWKIYRGNY